MSYPIALSLVYVLGMVTVSLSTEAAVYGDVTDRIELLGNPYEHLYPDYNPEMIYARNIWDMQAFDGRIYVGAGNSSNMGPAVNAGPLPIISYDPATGSFRSEFVVDDEQIDLYQVLDGRLVVPGHDPTESWRWGNFYRLEDDGWKKYRNIPDGIHNYFMISHEGRLYAGLGTRYGAAVSVSEDDGQTWTNHPAPSPRVYALFRCQDQLYASGYFAHWDPGLLDRMDAQRRQQLLERYPGAVAELRDGQWVSRPDLDYAVMFPSPQPESGRHLIAKMVKPVEFQDTTVYIGARIHNDHQFVPMGVFAARSLAAGAPQVDTLEAVAAVGTPWDLFTHDGTLYVLTGRRQANGSYRVTVLQTPDLKNWSQVLYFHSPAFARSFELLDDAFYFGLGCEVEIPTRFRNDELLPETGNILRFDPHQSQQAILLGNLSQAEQFISHLLTLTKHVEPERRALAHMILREFIVQHDPNRTSDRSGFLQRMEEIYQQSGDCAEREAAFRMLVLHSSQLGPEATAQLLADGLANACIGVQSLASAALLGAFTTPTGHQLIRDFHRSQSPALDNSLFAELINRPSPAFPQGLSAEDFSQIQSIELPAADWLFRKDPNVALGYLQQWFAPELDISDWQPARIGDFWAWFLDELYIGVGWYRLNWDVPSLDDADAIGLHFEAVDENAWVWINGNYAGQHNIGMDGWDKPFQIDATPFIRRGETNHITVRVKNTRGNGGIWKPVELRTFRKN